jgi:hypothetical protein
VVTAKARINIRDKYTSIVPVLVPRLDDVRQFAAKLHAEGQPWQGEAFGWQAEYNPEQAEPPLDSKMTYTPADFCIGENGIWFFSLTWERGKAAEPIEFLDDRNIVVETSAVRNAA